MRTEEQRLRYNKTAMDRYYKQKEKGLCIYCDNKATAGDKCERHAIICRASNRKQKQSHRQIVLDHYGNKCACCGETTPKFLTVDHINNDGAKHRMELFGGPYTINNWLIKNNFPPGYQLLCWNCNCGRRINNNVCPHKEIK